MQRKLHPGWAIEHARWKTRVPIRLLLDQSVLDRVASEFGVTLHFHLFEDSCAVSADGAYAQREYVCNFADRLAGSDQAHHFKFTIRKQFMGWAVCTLSETNY